MSPAYQGTYPASQTRQHSSMPSWAYQKTPGQPPMRSKISRRIATAPSQSVVAGPGSRGSPARSRGTQRPGPGRPVGSSTRGWMRPTSGRSANSAANRARVSGAARAASSSRKKSRSPDTSGTPALRPAGMPTFSGRVWPRTPSGRSTGSQPLPTTTMSAVTPSWASTDSRPRRSSSGRWPMVRTTTPNSGWDWFIGCSWARARPAGLRRGSLALRLLMPGSAASSRTGSPGRARSRSGWPAAASRRPAPASSRHRPPAGRRTPPGTPGSSSPPSGRSG